MARVPGGVHPRGAADDRAGREAAADAAHSGQGSGPAGGHRVDQGCRHEGLPPVRHRRHEADGHDQGDQVLRPEALLDNVLKSRIRFYQHQSLMAKNEAH